MTKTITLIAFLAILSMTMAQKVLNNSFDEVSKVSCPPDENCPDFPWFFCCSDVVNCDGPPTPYLHNIENYPMCGYNLYPPWKFSGKFFNTPLDIVAYCSADDCSK